MRIKFVTVIAVLLLLVASLSVAGCTTSTTSTTNNTNQTPSAPPSQQVVATATPTVREQVSAVKVTVPQQIGTYTPKAGNNFVAYNVTIRNIDVPKSSSNPENFKLRDTEENIYRPATATYDSSINGLDNVNTQPGDKVSGIIVYEVPQNATLKSLTYNSGYQNTIITL